MKKNELTSPWSPLGSSIVFTSSSAMSKALSPLSFFSQNSCGKNKRITSALVGMKRKEGKSSDNWLQLLTPLWFFRFCRREQRRATRGGWRGGAASEPVGAGRPLSEDPSWLCCWGGWWLWWRAAWRWTPSVSLAATCSGRVCPGGHVDEERKK